MKGKEEEYKEIFLAEALENFSEVSRLLTILEKNFQDLSTIQAIFRIVHTLKGNATGLGYTQIAEISHLLEDVFSEIKENRLQLNSTVFETLYKATDTLGELIGAIKNPKEVKYRGVKTKLEVLLKNLVLQVESAAPREILEAIELEGTTPEPEGLEAETTDNHVGVALTDTVQVPVRKLDNLLNLVSELVIERDRLAASTNNGYSTNEFSRLNRISSDLQYSVMDVRLVQVGFLFQKFHRIVRDVSSKEGKNISLKLDGTETEIDRNILQVISDSLIHLIRNAVSHGIELPDERIKCGKAKEGTILLKAESESDNVILTISDDGGGINVQRVKEKALAIQLITKENSSILTEDEIIMLIFEPGFSTMTEVTEISGRGVGMDVVKRALDSIGGTIRVISKPGEGTSFILTLPSSMAVKSTLLFELQQQVYAIPLAYTESVISIDKSDINKAFNGLVTINQGNTILLIWLPNLLHKHAIEKRKGIVALSDLPEVSKLDVVIVNYAGRRLGLIVDKLLQQKEIVEKPLKKPADGNSLLSGATIMGNGNVCLVLSVPGLYNYFLKNSIN